MPTRQIIFAIVTFLHDLFTVLWIGGLATLAIVVVPAARQVFGTKGETRKLMRSMQQRLSWVVYVSMIGLVVTGFLLSRRSPAFTGLFQVNNTYSLVLTIKHVFVVAMIAIGLYRRLVLAAGRGARGEARENLAMTFLYVNFGIGVAILLLSGFTAALASGPPPIG
jgi:putative copper export protein